MPLKVIVHDVGLAWIKTALEPKFSDCDGDRTAEFLGTSGNDRLTMILEIDDARDPPPWPELSPADRPAFLREACRLIRAAFQVNDR